MRSRLTPHEAQGILLGCGAGGVCGATSGGRSSGFTSACLWPDWFEPARKIEILSVVLAGSLKSVWVRVPLGLSCDGQM